MYFFIFTLLGFVFSHFCIFVGFVIYTYFCFFYVLIFSGFGSLVLGFVFSHFCIFVGFVIYTYFCLFYVLIFSGFGSLGLGNLVFCYTYFYFRAFVFLCTWYIF